MYHKIAHILPTFLLFMLVFQISSASYADSTSCSVADRLCVIGQLKNEAAKIKNTAWRDQTYREIAKTYMFEGKFSEALALVEMINTPDTKAMTIRGIGMTLAAQDYDKKTRDDMFQFLRKEAETINHGASYAIALTYIAMAQAFSGDNEGAWTTAEDMTNAALRHKAYGETAEIQAEKGDFSAARHSIEKIDSLAFRNKAYSIVSGILADKALHQEAYEAAMSIENAYKRAQALQYVLDAQKPRDVKH